MKEVRILKSNATKHTSKRIKDSSEKRTSSLVIPERESILTVKQHSHSRQTTKIKPWFRRDDTDLNPGSRNRETESQNSQYTNDYVKYDLTKKFSDHDCGDRNIVVSQGCQADTSETNLGQRYTFEGDDIVQDSIIR
jgi:hypothetical protein